MAEIPQAAEEAVKKIDSKLECSICLDSYKEPKLLPCFHIFCKSPCLQRLVVQGPEGQTLTCPTCRHLVTLPDNGVAGLQTDFHIDHLHDIRDTLKRASKKLKKRTQCQICDNESTAVKFCQQCSKLMCEECTQVHNKWGNFKDHKTMGIDEVETAQHQTPGKQISMCQKHSTVEAKIYCETCSELICSDCTVSIHKEHKCSLIDDVFQECKTELSQSLVPLQELLKEMDEALKNCDGKTREVRERKTRIQSSMELKINQLHELIDQRKDKLLESLESKTEQKLKELATHKDWLEKSRKQVVPCLQYAEGGLEAEVEGELVRMKAPVLKRIEEVTAQFDTESLQPQTEADIELVNTENAEKICREFGEIICDPVSAENSYATGNGTTFAVAETQTSVRLHVMTTKNKKYEEQLDLSANLVHFKNKATITCETTQVNGQYKISYQPFRRGKHSLQIKIRDHHIQGSPFSVAVTPSLESLGRPVRIIRGLNKPYGMTTNSVQKMVVIERSDHKHCITILTPGGERLHTFGSRGARAGQFEWPHSLTVDHEDNIYVADKDNHRIQKFSPDGKFLASVGTQGSRDLHFSYPNSIAFNKTEHTLYVCDRLNHRIQALTTDLKHVRNLGEEGSENGQLKSPLFCAFNSSNNLYVTDQDNNRVQVFTADGQFLRAFFNKANGGHLQKPFAIAIDSSDTVYVSEWDSNSISLFTPSGRHIVSFGGTTGTKEGQFNKIRGLHIDQRDSICVTDQKNNRLQIF